MMLCGEDPVHAAIPPEGLSAEPLPGLPSPRLTFTGRFRADKASEVLVAALALLTARPAYLVGSLPTMARLPWYGNGRKLRRAGRRLPGAAAGPPD